MDLNQGLADLVAVALVAALAPLVVAVRTARAVDRPPLTGDAAFFLRGGY